MNPGFLFDNDGVLMDSGEFHWQAWQALSQENPSFNMTHEQFLHSFGKTNDLIFEELNPNMTSSDRKKLAQRKEELFRKFAKGKIELLPGMENFLKEIKKSGIKSIIASSAPIENLEFFLKETPLKNYFDHYVSGESVEKGKPFPDVFLEAAKRIGLPPKDCIVLEDSLAGMESGKKAGAFVVGLATSLPIEKLKNYDLVYPSPKELDLLEIIQKWKQFRE